MARGREAHELLEQRALLPPLAVFILGRKDAREVPLRRGPEEARRARQFLRKLPRRRVHDGRLLAHRALRHLPYRYRLGVGHTIHARGMYAISLYGTDDDAAVDDLILAEKVLEETNRTARQVLGRGHPTAQQMLTDLSRVREKLARVRANP